LKSLGVESVAKADLDDTKSLTEAFKGCYGVYGVTDFWALYPIHKYNQAETAAHETQHGKNLVDAAKAAGIQHFVWSTLDHGDTVHCPHFRSKYNVNAFVEASGIPYTLFYTSCYYSNLIGFKMLNAEDDGTYTLNIPIPSDIKIHWFDGADVGRWVLPILKDSEKYNGKSVQAVSEYLNPREVADIITRVSGKKCNSPPITKEEFYTEAFKQKVGNDEIWLNWQLWVEGKMTRDSERSNAVAPNPVTLGGYLKTNHAARQFLGIQNE